jgi:hypothetical protein
VNDQARTRTWRVEDGEVHVYRLFDIAEAVDLARAEALVTAPKSRLRLEGAQSATALDIPRPPLHLVLGPRTVTLGNGSREVETSAHVFDFGVASILYKFPIAPGTALEELLPLAEELLSGTTAALDAAARRETEELGRALAPALEGPHVWEGHETYQLVYVRSFDAAAPATELLASAPIAQLLLGETSTKPLSDAEQSDVLQQRWSYLEEDLAVVDWNSAFVVEPSGVQDIPDLLEFATAHLLELRFYDALLDRELNAIYDELARTGRTLAEIFTRRYRRLQRRTAALLLEISEMIERLENAVKIVGDFYLARLYQGAVRRFRLPAWQETVLRKQRLLAEVNALLGSSADTNRGQLMELAVILLILGELLLAIRVH